MQTSFSEPVRAAKKKVKRRDCFLSQIDVVTPLAELLSALVLYYPKSDKRRRPLICLERLLRVYVEKCFCLSDKEMEDAVYDSQAIWNFIGVDLNREAAPDTTRLPKFRSLLDTQHLEALMLAKLRSMPIRTQGAS